MTRHCVAPPEAYERFTAETLAKPHIYSLWGRWMVSSHGWRERSEKHLGAWDIGFSEMPDAFAWAAKCTQASQ